MRSDLVETFKVINGKYDINPELYHHQTFIVGCQTATRQVKNVEIKDD